MGEWIMTMLAATAEQTATAVQRERDAKLNEDLVPRTVTRLRADAAAAIAAVRELGGDGRAAAETAVRERLAATEAALAAELRALPAARR